MWQSCVFPVRHSACKHTAGLSLSVAQRLVRHNAVVDALQLHRCKEDAGGHTGSQPASWAYQPAQRPAAAPPPKISVMALDSMPPPSISSTALAPVEILTISRALCAQQQQWAPVRRSRAECMPRPGAGHSKRLHPFPLRHAAPVPQSPWQTGCQNCGRSCGRPASMQGSSMTLSCQPGLVTSRQPCHAHHTPPASCRSWLRTGP